MTIGNKKISPAVLNLGAMVVGAILGLVFGKQMSAFKFIGDIWLNCLKMVVVPMVLCIMVSSITAQKDMKALGRVSVKIITYFFVTLILACLIGMGSSFLLKPGNGLDIAGMSGQEVDASGVSFTFTTFIKGLFSSNMFQTLTEGNVMQTMVIAILLGVSIQRIKNEERKAFITNWFASAQEMVMALIKMIINVAPIGILFLIADSFGTYGASIFSAMAGMIGTFWFGCLMQVILVYGCFLWFGAGVNPIRFIKDSAELWVFTISACSSAAAIPVSIKVAKEKFNVPDRIASFCIPLSNQINYNGSAILYSSVTIFIYQMYGMPLDAGTLIKIILMATMLSCSGGGIPGSGIVKLMIMVEAFAMPTEIVGIIAGFYRFFDMGTTTMNCLGGLVGSTFVSKLEEKSQSKVTNSIS